MVNADETLPGGGVLRRMRVRHLFLRDAPGEWMRLPGGRVSVQLPRKQPEIILTQRRGAGSYCLRRLRAASSKRASVA